MGFDKATLQVAGESVLARLIARLDSPLGRPWILCRSAQNLEIPVGSVAMHDVSPGDGPLVALSQLAIQPSSAPVLVVPCDMPDLPFDLGSVFAAAQASSAADAVLVRKQGRREPLPVLLMPSALRAVAEAVRLNARRADAWHGSVAIHDVDAEAIWGEQAVRSFRNVNSQSHLTT